MRDGGFGEGQSGSNASSGNFNFQLLTLIFHKFIDFTYFFSYLKILEMFISISIPANKCGLVIGKNGETIKNINSSTGAHCKIDKSAPSDARYVLF